MNAIALTFQNTQFNVVDRSGQPWLRGLQIASALGYRNPSTDIANLYDRNADEFTDSMTALVELETEGGKQKVRIFSLRGCHLLGMLSRTKVAKEFRKWVLDVLEHHTQPRNGLVELPEPPTINKAQIGVLYNRVVTICGGSGKIRAEIWSRFQNHFQLGSYKDLPASRYDEAMAYLDARQTEYLGEGVEMLYLSNKELQAKIEEAIQAKEGELLPREHYVIKGGIVDAGDRIAITTFYDKKEFFGYMGRIGYDLVNRNDYLVIKKDEVLQKLQA
ncbi:BRO family protein [Methylomonas rapida]|uniref:BRO family protein n=1 Tax=Methylomonas rapida TaxID=2963939 RepID=A0ABY7GQX4_9GAMM|nr:BRO family protein [Methylomonas rapida]WAR46903.1 BRO family protein [Methylomonas rapida]